MNGLLLGLVAPLLSGQIYAPPGGGIRPLPPPVVVTNPGLGATPGRMFDSTPTLKGSLDGIGSAPALNIPGSAAPGGSPAPSASDTSRALPSATTASRDLTSVATPSGMVPPPPYDVNEPPQDGGDDDDEDDKGSSAPFPWGKTLLFVIVGGLILYGMTRP